MLRKLLMLTLLSPLAAQAGTIYLCKAYSGGMFWSQEHCNQHQALIERIASVPDGLPFDQQVQLGEQSRAEAARLSAPPPTSSHSTSTSSYTVNGKRYAHECQALAATITQIESQQRQPLQPGMQDRLTAHKRQVRDRQFQLRC
ncbi:hypothetical protein [Sphaerotilus mobilis]|uniref:DUF4124 domain-containing protein n=1 Tax=Sphaerotilus mobilis TaxID=47994 RepID=A0A4Q7LTJ8_9BURK|nr:hypothetical protein [Sphaerotilus mobilis]RZS57129.1 hypothetical protein EV685_1694 [Sphaerotilus mobilis]